MQPDDVQSQQLRLEQRRARLEERLQALSHGTVGPTTGSAPAPSPQMVTAPGSYALSIDGDFALGGFVFSGGSPLLHTDGAGYFNTAVGLDAMVSLTPGVTSNLYGSRNTALGYQVLKNTTEGYSNTASGAFALYSNTTGAGNTAIGPSTLYSNTTGASNIAIAPRALYSNTEGSSNVAIGNYALYSNTTGVRNIALGWSAGNVNTTGSDNIWIASSGAEESNTLRIGGGSGNGAYYLSRAFISGIHNAVLGGADEHPVCVDDSDQLGMCGVSSARFKRDVREMGVASAGVGALRPVVFKYRPEVKDDAEKEQFGLIAEEVAEVFPHLVTTDAEGRPLAVRYDLLTPLLLNELQRAQTEIEAQREEIAALRREVLARLQRLESGDP